MRSSARELGSGFGGKMCTKGKSCGATCIDAQERCELELGPLLQSQITRTRDELEKYINLKLEKVNKDFVPYTSDKQVIDYLAKNVKQLATEGMEEGYYGGPGQRGSIRSKVWLIGQEAYARPDRMFPGAGLQEINRKLEGDPVQLINVVRMHKELHDAARKEAPKSLVTPGVEKFLRNQPFKFGNDTNVTEWAKNSGSTYYGKMGRILEGMGFSGNIAGANISSLLQPPGQEGSGAIVRMLKKNGLNPKTFADGAFASKDAWYNYSAKMRAPLISKAIQRLKPKLVYMGQQAEPESNKGFNYLLYNLAKEMKLTPYHVRHDGKDYKYIVMPHANGKRTVILNGWHPTAIGKGAIKVTDREFMKALAKSLQDTGAPQTGVVANPIQAGIMNKVLGIKGGSGAQVTPRPMVKSPGKVAKAAQIAGGSNLAKVSKVTVPMTEWSTVKLKKAYEVAGKKDNVGAMGRIAQILADRGVRV